MSYDFELYVRSAVALPSPPSIGEANVRCDGPFRVEDEDIPDLLLPVVGKRRWTYQIQIEGEVSAECLDVVDRWLRDIATASKGVLIDQQAGTYETAAKLGKLAMDNSRAQNTGTMSFYFEGGEEFYERGLEAVFEALKKHCPSALPTRYGYSEPLQGTVRQGEVAEIVSAFQKDTSIFMMAPAPFGHIFVSAPCRKTFENWHPRHFLRRHHLLGTLGFDLRPRIFASVARRDQLLKIFEILCAELNVVYAEILEEGGGASWFWYGMPDRPQAHAICIGAAYQRVWPEAANGGRVVGEGLRVFAKDRLGNSPPRPPAELLRPPPNPDGQGKPNIAEVFPFDYEFDYNKFVW